MGVKCGTWNLETFGMNILCGNVKNIFISVLLIRLRIILLSVILLQYRWKENYQGPLQKCFHGILCRDNDFTLVNNLLGQNPLFGLFSNLFRAFSCLPVYLTLLLL